MNPIRNLGSLNIDHVYRVTHFVRPGETLASTSYHRGAGGKGFNQTVALARAGATVAHIGACGPDGAWLREMLLREGADTTHLRESPDPTGHAIIQVSGSGENAIILHGGANRSIGYDAVLSALTSAPEGSWFLTQNETDSVPEAIRLARQLGLTVCFNAAPMDPAVLEYPLAMVDWLVVNETEGAEISGREHPDAIADALAARYPSMGLVLTLGSDGVLCRKGNRTLRLPAPQVGVVDTTAAGDTFTGFFVAAMAAGLDLEPALARATHAAALTVTRPGAAPSIPFASELE
jgi:ribokinase